MKNTKSKIRIALYSVLVGIILTGVKFTVGLLSGSLGIMSEALHSLLDLAAALITFFSVRISEKPPDEQHQYGHGKVENLSALVEALLLLTTCAWIVTEAVERLVGKPVHIEAGVWEYLVMTLSLVLDVFISRLLSRGARKYSSQALEADALHYSSDIFSSAVVIAGLIGVNLGIRALDAVAALGVAILITVASLRLSKRAIGELIDRAPAGLKGKIVESIQGISSVKKVESMRLRQSGAATFVDLIVSARRMLSLATSHELADEIENKVKAVIPNAQVLVHFHPSSSGETPVETVRAVVDRFPEIQEAHNIQSYRNEKNGKYFLSLHVKLSTDLSLEKAHHLVDLLEEEMKREIPDVEDIQTHIETAESLSAGTREKLQPFKLRALRADVLKDPRVRGIHEVFVHRSSSGMLISCHITTGEKLHLAEAHQAATVVEQKIKALFPEAYNVIVHAEPAAASN